MYGVTSDLRTDPRNACGLAVGGSCQSRKTGGARHWGQHAELLFLETLQLSILYSLIHGKYVPDFCLYVFGS